MRRFMESSDAAASLESRPLVQAVLGACLFCCPAKEADDVDRPEDITLAGKADGAALPSLPDQRERLGEPEPKRKTLEPGGRGQVFAAGNRDDRARGALPMSAAPLPETRVRVERGVPEPITFPNVDCFPIDDAADFLRCRFSFRRHARIIEN